MANLDESEWRSQRNGGYFLIIAGNGYLLVAILSVLFYVVAALSHKGRISVGSGAITIILFWIASISYMFWGMYEDFRKVYKYFLGRMRANSRFAWVAIVYVCGALLCVPPLIYFFHVGFYDVISREIRSYSLKMLIATFSASLFCSMLVMVMVVNVIAARRGVRRFETCVTHRVGLS